MWSRLESCIYIIYTYIYIYKCIYAHHTNHIYIYIHKTKLIWCWGRIWERICRWWLKHPVWQNMLFQRVWPRPMVPDHWVMWPYKHTYHLCLPLGMPTSVFWGLSSGKSPREKKICFIILVVTHCISWMGRGGGGESITYLQLKNHHFLSFLTEKMIESWDHVSQRESFLLVCNCCFILLKESVLQQQVTSMAASHHKTQSLGSFGQGIQWEQHLSFDGWNMSCEYFMCTLYI